MDTTIKKILLVDDDPDECFLFRKALSEIAEAPQLQFVSDCDDLHPALVNGSPQLIFMDINIPKKSGFDCLEEINKVAKYKNLPVVVYSCSDLQLSIAKAFGSGAHLYLRKPFSYEGLVSSLKKILSMDWNHPESIRENYLVGGRYYAFEVA